MSTFRLLFFISVLLIKINSYSQKYELGTVTKEELTEKSHPKDSSAVAAILFKKAKTTFTFTAEKGFDCKTEFTIKIKIYKKKGLEWADLEIPYYTGYKDLEDEMVEISKAYTYNFEEGKINKVKVNGEGKNVEKINEYWKNKVVTFPNVKEGSIIELKYILKSENLSVLPEFQFQYEIPVNFIEYTTEIPEFYIYKAMFTGNFDIQFKDKIEYTSESFEERVDKSLASKSISYRQIISNYSLKDIKALKKEEFVTNIDNYFGKIEHELQTIRMPDEDPKQIATDWESVTKSIYKETSFGDELKKNNYFPTSINSIFEADESDIIKATKIYKHIQNHMNWDGKYGYLTKKGVESAYYEKTGNVAEINLMLTSLLRLIGFDAKPIIISTRDNGLTQFPNRSKFNYVITGVTIDNKTILLDATDKNASFTVLPIRTLNWFGRMINSNGTSSEINLMPEFLSNKTTIVMGSIQSDGSLEGKIREQHYDYNALIYKEKYGKLAQSSYLEILEKNRNGSEISEFTVSGADQFDKPVIENYTFKNSNSTEVIGDKMFFSPMLFFATLENPFKQEKREYPVDFTFPNQNRYTITIKIPDGYAVESMPESGNFSMKDGLVVVKYLITNTNNSIQLSYTKDINSAFVDVNYYDELKSIFNEIVTKENAKVVLKKI